MSAYIPIKNLISLIQKRFLSSTTSAAVASHTAASSSSSSFTVRFLINSCGLPLNAALLASQKLQLDEKTIQNTQSVLEFLKSYDFNDTHIGLLIKKRPQVLQGSVKYLAPKFEFFAKNGFVGQLLPELIISNPFILIRGLDTTIKPNFEFLKSVLGCKDKISTALKRASWYLTTDLKVILRPNFDLLINEGMSVDRVAKLIMTVPRTILHKQDRMVYAMNCIKNLGLDPKGPMFIHALAVMLQMSATTWNTKIELMKSLGFTEEEVIGVFRRHPYFLACSEKKIKLAMDFFMNTVKLEPNTILTYPSLFSMSIDKRIRPRYNVFKALESNNLIKADKKIALLLRMRDKDFLDTYVTRYADKVPDLLQIYGSVHNSRKTGSFSDAIG